MSVIVYVEVNDDNVAYNCELIATIQPVCALIHTCSEFTLFDHWVPGKSSDNVHSFQWHQSVTQIFHV